MNVEQLELVSKILNNPASEESQAILLYFFKHAVVQLSADELDSMLPGPPADPKHGALSAQQYNTLQRLMYAAMVHRQGGLVPLIKEVRQMSGLGLKEAKELVDYAIGTGGEREWFKQDKFVGDILQCLFAERKRIEAL